MTDQQQPGTITIGILAAGAEDPYAVTILNGAFDFAREHGINLVWYAGYELESALFNQIHQNVIYKLANSQNMDALMVLSGTLMNFVGSARLEQFCEDYGVPIVSLGGQLSNAYSILVDNTYGMCEAVRHLIIDHGLRRIAFVCGPKGNDEAALRFQAYLDVLDECGVAYDPQLVVPGNFITEDGKEAVRLLMDERKVEFDAIVAANDMMAIAALHELKRRNIAVPDQVAIVGFDDIEDTQCSVPALTTVRQPLYEQGKQGVISALALLGGEVLPEQSVLKTELVIRRSCGCFPKAPASYILGETTVTPIAKSKRFSLLERIDVAGIFKAVNPSQYIERFQELYNAFLADLQSSASDKDVTQFVRRLDSLIQYMPRQYLQSNAWHNVLMEMRRQVLPLLTSDVALYIRAENLWHEGQIVILNALQQFEAEQQLKFRLQTRILNTRTHALLTVTDIHDLAAILSNALPYVGIKSCYISLYEDTGLEWCRLIFAYDQHDDELQVSDEQPQIRSSEAVNYVFSRINRQCMLIVEALHFREVHLGFMILEIEKPQIYIYEVLREQLGSVFNARRIIQQLEGLNVELKTAQRRAEQANNAKSSFLSNMSHEVRTPLNVILGYSSLMLNRPQMFGDVPLPETYRHYLRLIEENGQYLVGLINDILDLSKIEAGSQSLNEEHFDVHSLLHRLKDMFSLRAAKKDLDLKFELFVETPLFVRGDEGKLRQVLINLLGNAIKFTDEGHVILRVYSRTQADNLTEQVPQMLNLYFEIEDTGRGIPAEAVTAIFEPFVQANTSYTNSEGAGLGLTISRRFVRMMGGDLAVESTPYEKTVFSFNVQMEAVSALPAIDYKTARRVIGIEADEPAYRLLVVEDKEENRTLLVNLLTSVGFEVREATNGQEGIKQWENWQPHLIWMDIRMPYMDGYQVTKHIKALPRGSETVIIALTASAFEHERDQILAAGCDDFLTKPFQEASIFEALEKHLKVRFIHESAENAPLASTTVFEFTSQSLNAVPSIWREDMAKAALSANSKRIYDLIDQIRAQNSGLANMLVQLTKDYRFDKIYNLVEVTGKNNL